MTTLKYTSARPDETLDALQTLESDWTANPTQEPDTVLVVARVGRTGIGKPKAGGDWVATAGITHVEILTGAAAQLGEKLLAEAYGIRTGADQVQLEFPDDSDPLADAPVEPEIDDFDAAPPVSINTPRKKSTTDGPEVA